MAEGSIYWALKVPIAERAAWQAQVESWESWPSVITETADAITIEVHGLAHAEALLLVATHGGEVKEHEPVDWAETTAFCQFPIQVSTGLWLARECTPPSRMNASTVLWLPDTEAFGAHGHPSTMGSLRLLTQWVDLHPPTPNAQLYDLGCGMGVLSVASSLLGFGHVTGYDIDAKAVQAARACSQSHGQSQIRFETCDLLGDDWQAPRVQADLVCANLFADLIITLLPHMRQMVKPSGALILGGILDRYAKRCFDVLAAHDLTLELHDQQGPWHALLAVAP